MANKKFSDLTATTTLASNDIFAIETAGGNTRRITAANAAAGLKTVGFRGCLAKLSADKTTQNYSSNTTVAWDGADEYDTDSIHDPVTNNSRLTVPSGVSYVRVCATLSISLATAADWISLRLIKNGAAAVGLPFLLHEGGSTNQGMIITTPVLAVSATDYFEVQMQVESDTSITVNANRSGFAMEIVA